jgi:hypothetical protein
MHDIIKNVTLSLPASYELVMGNQLSQVPWYFANVNAAMLADLNSFTIVMFFPLTIVNRKFEVYQLFAFDSRISNSTFVKLKIDNKYLAVRSDHRNYFTLTESEYSQCRGENIKI